MLFIGVADDGEVTGIGVDNYKTDDQFSVALFNFIMTALSAEVATFEHVRVVRDRVNL